MRARIASNATLLSEARIVMATLSTTFQLKILRMPQARMRFSLIPLTNSVLILIKLLLTRAS
jgi:hypothetical protein